MTAHSRKAVPKRHSSTLLNTLNCGKPVIYVPYLCRATTEVDLDCLRQRCKASGFTGSISSSFLPFNLEYSRELHKDCIDWILDRAAWRAGHVARAAINGVSERDILLQTRHKSAEILAKCVSGG